MLSSWTFVHTENLSLIIFVGLLLWGLMIWKDWHLRGKSLFYIHLLISFLAILALVFIFLKPGIQKESEQKLAYVLTEGYREEVRDSLLKVNGQIEKINYQPNEDFRNQLVNFDQIFVLGKGFETYDLWQMEGLEINYLNETDLSGIMELSYPSEINPGEPLTIFGKYAKPKDGHRLFLLNSSGVELDSVSLGSQAEVFELNAEPKVSGKFLYSLEERNRQDSVISSDPIPMIIKEIEKLRILVLNQFPTFETKFLKNYLAENGHELILRTELTRNRYKFEALNTDTKSINSLSRDILNDFDLLIIDTGTYLNLRKAEREELLSAIENGLGLFVQPNINLFSRLNKDFEFQFKNDGITRVEGLTNKTTLEKFPYNLKLGWEAEVLYRFDRQEVAFSIPVGSGQVGTSNLMNIYPVLLEGNKELYESYWKNILGKIARNKSVSEFEPKKFWVYQDHPFPFDLRTIINKPDVLDSDGHLIPLVQDIDVSTTWSGITYPLERGWNQLSVRNDSTGIFNFYVIDTSNWRSLRSFQTQQENSRFFEQLNTEKQPKWHVKPINPIWFFLSFLCCMAYLWLSNKLLE